MDRQILENAQAWAQNEYFSDQDRKEIADLLINPSKNLYELTERFYRDLEFGTGGLRAPMGMGPNRMNKYNVRRATQALSGLVLKKNNQASAVISYDSRNNSKMFAMEAAGVFAANGIKAFVFSELTPTPILSFAIRQLKAQAGIMITASHNPPIYNGFKAYWNDGAQVVPPIDKEIIQAYNSLSEWSLINFISPEEALKENLIIFIGNEINEAFYQMIKEKVIQNPALCLKHGQEISIIYTALHGTGNIPCNQIAQKLGFTSFHNVKSQMLPDGNFSTVKSPNPEDPNAMKMAIDEMIKLNADIAYGTDPDGDRLGVVINNRGKPHIINGNQIAVLMLYYIFKQKASTNTLPANALVIKSIVTSPIQNAIVESFGGIVQDTLTGFKWMADLLHQHELNKAPYHFIFASEESFGYMPHSESRDKDGVSSVALMSEVALFYKRQNKNLIEALDEIYEEFGFFQESLLSFDYEGIPGSEKISRIMDYFRNYGETHFAEELIVAKEDYEKSQSFDLISKSIKVINLPKSNVLSFSFESGNKVFLRPSGTEPKIKFYTMVKETKGSLKEKKEQALKKITLFENKIKETCEKA